MKDSEWIQKYFLIYSILSGESSKDTPTDTADTRLDQNTAESQIQQEKSSDDRSIADSHDHIVLDNNDNILKSPETENKGYEPWSADECRDALLKLFEPEKTVHNCYKCSQSDCTNISKHEEQRIQPKKFQHSWLKRENWWLCYVEGEGMFCLVCRKHHMRHPQNQMEVFASTPSIRYKSNAIKTHSTSNLHIAGLHTEMLQKGSFFHQELVKKSEVNESVLEQVFATVYFQMKTFIANRQFVPLLNFIEQTFSVESLKYFTHRSCRSQAEIFKLLGQTVKSELIKKVKNALAFGLLTDEVADVSVTENLVTFIQFYNRDTDSVETQFLACQNVLSEFQSANAESISALLLKELEENDDLNLNCLTGFTSDGASVMVGKRSGVAARLKQVNPVLINVHCICHRLALACTDSNESLSYIKNIENWLRQLWQFFENSPRRMSAYLKLQTELKSIKLNKITVKKVVKRLKKACRTRWLSLGASVAAVKEDYEAIMQTLALFENSDATASGLLKKLRSLKFIGTIYILSEVLPVLGQLSKTFQKGSVSFAAILPAVNMTKDSLQSLLENETPIEKLQTDIDSFTDMCAEIKMNQKDASEIQSLFKNYTTALIQNIDRRFTDNSDVLAAFSVFDPVALPDNAPELKVYGETQMVTICHHYFKDNEDKHDRLMAQWQGIKYYIRDVIKPQIPQSVKEGNDKTPTEWLLLELMKHTVLKQLYPDLLYIVEVVLSLPVSNAWPERGASTLKAFRTRLRNRLSPEMLESLMHVCINAPEPTSPEGKKLVKLAVKSWLQTKNRRKLPKIQPSAPAAETQSTAVVVEDTGVQTEPLPVVSDEVMQSAVQSVMKTLHLEGYSEGEEEEEYEDDCVWKYFE